MAGPCLDSIASFRGDGVARAFTNTRAAVDAIGSVDGGDRIAFGDGAGGADVLAGAAGLAGIGNDMGHISLLVCSLKTDPTFRWATINNSLDGTVHLTL